MSYEIDKQKVGVCVFVYAYTQIKGMIYNVIKDALLYYYNIASCYLYFVPWSKNH
jgi:hypothetical protein